MALTVLEKLDGKKHVFVDWSLIEPGYGLKWGGDAPGSYEMSHGMELNVHPPRIDWEPIIEADRPWEKNINWHTTIFEDEGRFRLYYRIWDLTGGDTGHADTFHLAYAESEDGVNWVKPNVGTFSFQGSTDNNIIHLDFPPGSPMVFKDPSASDDERYKLVFRGQIDGIHQIWGATSADGLRWNKLDEPLIVGYHSDTHNVFKYDEVRGKYIGYFRGWDPPGTTVGRRTIAYAETEDFTKWPTPKSIVWPDSHDGPHADIYTNSYAAWPDGNAHLTFPCMYERERDILEMHLFTSRDGLRWDRISRDPIIPQGPPGSGLSSGVWAGAGLVSINRGEWSMPISPQALTHNMSLFSKSQDNLPHRGFVCLATWREDGFTSIEAKSQGGFSTSPFTFSGSRLKLNSWSHYGGQIKVELVEAPDGPKLVEAPPVPGRSFAECDVVTGDNLSHTVTWNGDPDLSAWASKPVRLRFKLLRSRLHAMQVT